jgi:hypothetical protein
MSKEQQQSLGPIVSMLPMPMTEASIESIESTPTGYKVVLHLVGEGDTLRLETRWKDRDGRPTIVEASRVHEEQVGPAAEAEAGEGDLQ